MADKKFRFGMAVVVVLLLFLVACTSTSPVFYSNNTQKDFAILGEVTYEGTNKTGFQELLKAAREQYPTCDYVIDVMLDEKKTTFLFFRGTSYIFRGTAIEYKE